MDTTICICIILVFLTLLLSHLYDSEHLEQSVAMTLKHRAAHKNISEPIIFLFFKTEKSDEFVEE